MDPAPLDEPWLRYADAPRLPEGGAVDVRTLLETRSPRLEIEVGPGRGGFMYDRLLAYPETSMVAFEVKRKWATIVNERLARRGIAARGRVFADDAKLALARLGPDGAVDAFFFHFPDPWWKKRHQKRLVIGGALLDQVARLLRPGGELFVQTDVDERAELYETQIGAHGAYGLAGDSPRSARMAENPYGARSHRERRAIDDAIPVYRLRFARK